MAFTAHIDISKKFKVKASFDTVFDTLADVPYSVEHFPNVDNLVDLGDECYRWEMAKIGIDRWHIQTIYACEYCWDKEEGWIEWYPIEGEGNALVEGKWTIKAVDKKNTQVSLKTTGDLTLPLPGLAKPIVSPIVRREFEGLIDRYIENLKKTWTK